MSPETVARSTLIVPDKPARAPPVSALSALALAEPLSVPSTWRVVDVASRVMLRITISFGSVRVGVLLPQPTTAIARRTPDNAREDRLVPNNSDSSLTVHSRGNIDGRQGGRQAGHRVPRRPRRRSHKEPRAKLARGSLIVAAAP